MCSIQSFIMSPSTADNAASAAFSSSSSTSNVFVEGLGFFTLSSTFFFFSRLFFFPFFPTIVCFFEDLDLGTRIFSTFFLTFLRPLLPIVASDRVIDDSLILGFLKD